LDAVAAVGDDDVGRKKRTRKQRPSREVHRERENGHTINTREKQRNQARTREADQRTHAHKEQRMARAGHPEDQAVFARNTSNVHASVSVQSPCGITPPNAVLVVGGIMCTIVRSHMLPWWVRVPLLPQWAEPQSGSDSHHAEHNAEQLLVARACVLLMRHQTGVGTDEVLRAERRTALTEIFTCDLSDMGANLPRALRVRIVLVGCSGGV
jgi:hypothetical protein